MSYAVIRNEKYTKDKINGGVKIDFGHESVKRCYNSFIRLERSVQNGKK